MLGQRPCIDALKRVAGRQPMTVDEATQLRVIQCDRAIATASASIRVTRQMSFNFLWSPYGIGQTITFWFCCFFLSSTYLFFHWPNLSGPTLDVYHTSIHDVALVW